MAPHAQSGSPLRISARDWNAVIQAAQAVAADELSPPSPELAELTRSQTVAKIKNADNVLFPRFGVCTLRSAAIQPGANLADFQQQPLFTALKPAFTSDLPKLAIPLEPIPPGQIGRAVIAGAAVCKIELSAGNTHARPATNNVTKLVGSSSGHLILFRPTSNGEQWCVILIGHNPSSPRRLMFGNPDGAPFEFWSHQINGAGNLFLNNMWSKQFCYGDIPVYNDSDKLRIRLDQLGVSEGAFEATLTLQIRIDVNGRALSGGFAGLFRLHESQFVLRLFAPNIVAGNDGLSFARVHRHIRIAEGLPNEPFTFYVTRRFWFKAVENNTDIYFDNVQAICGDNFATVFTLVRLRLDLVEIPLGAYETFQYTSSPGGGGGPQPPEGILNDTGTFFMLASSPPVLMNITGRLVGGGSLALSGPPATMHHHRRITTAGNAVETSSPAALIQKSVID